ncbi:hypothetical protein PsorP6_014647 [Peronosclerospora sorghi]|uniref:Uncharacterized protein n=1 Tax=Peronosclerospora sorghi TaxID=230839 RepID=A0ACC0VTM7_9STRA|nr:hypothetical protein PsorP6_014647 [Peronosclerospora sorghi]
MLQTKCTPVHYSPEPIMFKVRMKISQENKQNARLASGISICHRVLMIAQEDKLPHFSFIQSKMSHLADYVINVIRLSYPTSNEAKVPFHSQWRHF